MVGRLSDRNYFTRNYRVTKKTEGQEELLISEEEAFEILDGEVRDRNIEMPDNPYAHFIVNGADTYSGLGYIRFDNIDGLVEAELYTTSDKLPEGPGRKPLRMSILPAFMDPNRQTVGSV